MIRPSRPVRALLLADSHIGFDHPVRPRIRRRRRGHDFLANYQRVLRTAIDEAVDLVVHGGDVFHRARVPPSLVHQAFRPLEEVADAGIPVFLVPGNHERSRIPSEGLARHPGLHVLDEPGTVRTRTAGGEVAVSGIPCIRRNARSRFRAAVRATGWADAEADLRLLVTHQAFEGAGVGPADFTFRRGHDVIRLSDVPRGFAAVLSGHIHRSQVLETDLGGRPCPVPVLYPGSLERTAFAERHEPKGFMIVEVAAGPGGGSLVRHEFRDVGARPMEIRPLRVAGLSVGALERGLRDVLERAPRDAVLRLEADGPPAPGAERILSAASLRSLAPDTMNVEVVVTGGRRRTSRRRAAKDRRLESEDPESPAERAAGTSRSAQRSLFG